MKDTYCGNCLFSNTISSKKNPCNFNIIDKIKNTKTLDIDNDYYKIHNYLCKFGFSKKAYESNSESIKHLDLLSELEKRRELRYYLLIDARDVEDHMLVIDKLIGAKLQPKYLSILVNDDKIVMQYVNKIENIKDREYGYKIHCVIEQGDISKILPLIIDTNLRKNNTQYLWLTNIETISNIDKSIESIKEILHVYQPDCDLITHNIFHNNLNLYGLFLPFEYYIFMKDRFGSIDKAINSEENLKIVYYE